MNKLKLLEARAALAGVSGVSPELIAYERWLNLNMDAVLAHAGLLTVVLARFFHSPAGNVFSLDPDGVPSAVIEALLYDHQREQYVADLVAWPLHKPEEFGTILGPNVGADMLGVVDMVQRHGKPLVVHATPEEWLADGCAGCVPLNLSGGRYWLDKAGGPFLVRDTEQGRWLRDLLSPSGKRHRILVRIPEAKEAA